VAVDNKDFVNDVLHHFRAAGESTSATVPLKGPDREVAVTRYTYDDSQSSLSVNFYQRDKTQVAVVYRVKKGELAGEAKAIDMSLLTLGVDADAARLRGAYQQLNSKPKR
jgi:hypothetical protein